MITRERMERALTFLAETDEKFAYHKTHVEKCNLKMKAVRNAFFLRETGSIAERQAKAEQANEYKQAQEEYFAALVAFEHLKNKRNTESILIDTWRTVASAQKVGVDL